jgi:hypothetical protein
MRFWASLLLLALLLPATQVAACSLALKGPERDLPEALRNSDVAFVARLSTYSRIAPVGGKYYLGRIGYVVLERIKGRVDTQGALFERTSVPVRPSGAPAPACGPWVVTERNEGAALLIFASRSGPTGRLVPHPFSLRLDTEGSESEKWLELIRTTQRNEPTP